MILRINLVTSHMSWPRTWLVELETGRSLYSIFIKPILLIACLVPGSFVWNFITLILFVPVKLSSMLSLCCNVNLEK